MKGGVVAVFVVAGVLGFVAIVLSFVAETKRIKAENVVYTRSDGSCTYPDSPSMGMGIVAAVLLLIQQVLISVGTGCFCCRRKQPCGSSCCNICSVICFIFSWMIFLGALIMLGVAASLNNMYHLVKLSTKDIPCPVGADGLFAGAGVLSLISVVLAIVSYICFLASNNQNNTRGVDHYQHGVAMGQPHMPPKAYV